MQNESLDLQVRPALQQTGETGPLELLQSGAPN